MRTPPRPLLVLLLALDMLAFPIGAGATHATDPHSKNFHALGESFEPASFLEPPPLPPKPEIGFHIKEDALTYRVRKRLVRV